MRHLRLFATSAISAMSTTFLTVAVNAGNAAEPVWQIQPATSSIKFKVSQLGISTSGSLSKITGEVLYNGEDLSSARITADVPLDSINTGNGIRDKHLKTKDFFNVTKFPVAEFKSSAIKETKNGHFEIIGTLSLHGVSQEVTLEADPLKPAKDEAGKQHLSTTARGKVNRKTFGIGGLAAAAISADAQIQLNVDLIKG